MVLESLSLRTAYKEASRHRTGHGGWLGWIRRSKQPELPVVLLEDTGALVGLVFALAGVTLAHVTGEPRWDAVGSIAIGLLLVAIAILLAVEMKGLLIGESASPADIAAIAKALEQAPVRAAHHPPADRAPRPRRAARRRQARLRADADRRRAGRRSSTPPSSSSAPSCRPPTSCSSSPTCTGPRRRDRDRRHVAPRDRINAVAPIGVLAMVAAVLAFSSSSTIIKWAEVPGSVLAFWRMILAVALWSVVVAVRRIRNGQPPPSLATFRLVLPAGLAFGLNITLFFTAIGKTSIAHAEFIAASARSCSCRSAPCCSTSALTRGRCRGASSRSLGLAIVLFLGGTQGGASRGWRPARAVRRRDVDRLPRQRPPGPGDGRRRRLHGDDDADRGAHRGARSRCSWPATRCGR